MGTLARLTAAFSLPSGKIATINLDFSKTAALPDWTLADLQLLADAGKSGWSGSPNLRENFAADLGMVRCEAWSYDRVATGLPYPPGPKYQRERDSDIALSSSTLVPGTAAGVSLPPQVATVVTFRTGLGGRSRRGRVYLPPLPETQVDGTGTILLAWQTQLDGDFNDWVVGMQNAAPAVPVQTWTHEVVSMTLDSGFSRGVTSRDTGDIVDTQRRRRTRSEVRI